MKCDEFVALDDVVKPKVVYLAEVFNKKGKPTGLANVQETDNLAPVLVDEWKQTPKCSLLQKINQHFRVISRQVEAHLQVVSIEKQRKK